tara:strand:- start:33461 stop:35029 length:1569 start_codon:yes stop_codon:yes gene_type:complete
MPSENYDFVPWDSPDDIEKFLGVALQGARALGGKVLSAGAKLNTKRLALRNKIGEKLVPAAKNLITGKKEGPLASSPASEAVESMPSAPAPEMPEPEMPKTPSAPEPTQEASGFNPKKKQNQAMQFAQQSLASSQQRKQAQEQRAIEMARRGSEVGKAAPMDMAWRLLKMRNEDEENRIDSKFERVQRKIENRNKDAMEQLETSPARFNSQSLKPQSTLPMPLPLNRNLRDAIRNRDDMKVDNRNSTFTRLIPAGEARRDFRTGYEQRMRFKEGQPTPTKVEVRSIGNDHRRFALVDDEGNEYSKVSGINLHDKDARRIPTVTNTIGGLDAVTYPVHQRKGYYRNLLDTLLQNKIGVVSNNRNPHMSQPFHESFQQRLPKNIQVAGREEDKSKTLTESRDRTMNMYRYGFDPESEKQAFKDMDVTGDWGDLKPMFGSQYPMFGTVDKPLPSRLNPVSPRSSIQVQDNTDPTSPSVRFYRQSKLTEPRFDPNVKTLKDSQEETRQKMDESIRMSRQYLEDMFG